MLVLEFIFSKVAGLQPWTPAFSETFTKIIIHIVQVCYFVFFVFL